MSSKRWGPVRQGAIPPGPKNEKGGTVVAPPILDPGGRSPQTQKQDGGEGLTLKNKMASKQKMSKFLKEVGLAFA